MHVLVRGEGCFCDVVKVVHSPPGRSLGSVSNLGVHEAPLLSLELPCAQELATALEAVKVITPISSEAREATKTGGRANRTQVCDLPRAALISPRRGSGGRLRVLVGVRLGVLLGMQVGV